MNISILGEDSNAITIGCKCAYLMNNDNVLALTFETDEIARESEVLLKQSNLKTKHNTCEITVLNISNYNVAFN